MTNPKDKLTEEQKRELAEKEHAELVQREPPREVETPKATPPSLGEAMEASEDLTDFQAAIKMLHPDKLEQNSVMIGRIDPGVFLSALHLMSVDEIMRSDPGKDIDVSAIYMNNYVRLSIGLDGKGIIDIAELLGAAREEKKAAAMLSAGRLP